MAIYLDSQLRNDRQFGYRAQRLIRFVQQVYDLRQIMVSVQMRLELLLHHRMGVDRRIAAIEYQFVLFALRAPEDARRDLFVWSVADRQARV